VKTNDRRTISLIKIGDMELSKEARGFQEMLVKQLKRIPSGQYPSYWIVDDGLFSSMVMEMPRARENQASYKV
jgi:hypothetical protein